MEKFRTSWRRSESMLCVGLDPVVERFPPSIGSNSNAIRQFNREIIQATMDFACAYKPNMGFYLPYGHDGLDALLAIRDDVPDHIPVLLDAKVGDIDSTSEAYARAYFDAWGFDGVTAHAYLGHDSLAPLIEHEDRAVFVLAKTSNPGSGFLQDVEINSQPVSEHVAAAASGWNAHGNIGLVVGATYPDQLRSIRSIVGDMPILVPGVGAQSGDLAGAVAAGIDSSGYGLLINASRSISYASQDSDFADAARMAASTLRDQIEDARSQAILQTA
ncbi:MAG: orotidine-5'-phosphate decarboxylase [Thermomicrobiales bacterium]